MLQLYPRISLSKILALPWVSTDWGLASLWDPVYSQVLSTVQNNAVPLGWGPEDLFYDIQRDKVHRNVKKFCYGLREGRAR